MGGFILLGLNSCAPPYPAFRDRAYQMFPCPLYELPPNYAVVRVEGRTYYRSRDIYYVHCNGSFHRVSNPYFHKPIEIPTYLSYRRVVANGQIYYTRNGCYYVRKGKFYHRVANPHEYANYYR